ncbi:MAG: mandelate racemase/muconate lactonizing enzyme family protein [Bryobacteraceae bacterium]|nr:mandelate racemase/muconate lactonizing enzyme family protein [Solibacteraceae bacterium]MCO5352342.1 mandelate racemase/muconate lactonizing enzyme family protein [Bryobacteraceae bacterium]
MIRYDNMRIKRISTAVLEANFDWTIVRVETDEGVTGYGEAFVGPGLTAVIREFNEILVGEDPCSIDRLIRRMKASVIYASPGLMYHAIGGIESALLDVIGKRFGMPVWQILGGKYRDFVTVYADCHAGDALESITPMLKPRTPRWMAGGAPEANEARISVRHHGWDASKPEAVTADAYVARAREMAGRGFRVLKFDVDVPMPFETDEYNRGFSLREVDFAAEIVQNVRKAVGLEVELAIDCHWNYGVAAAIDLARALEPARLAWLEDPLPPENIAAFREVQNATKTTIATGENHFFRLDFQRLITEGGLRVLAPDVQKIGLWEGKKLADLADLHYVNLTWHNISGPLGTMAGVHLCAAIPNVLALEWHAASVPFFDEIVKDADGPMIVDGRIRVPDAPGLGVELDLDEAYKYRKPGEAFFE